ncbi:unnamed protein product [Porites lobata]|uniref:Uncharacterized protein n=1 Tax=Porites lobata TaxID=104759 RepID=A0ABN8PJ26_9CNID|nr:unnamed protein product [Porites lobata]
MWNIEVYSNDVNRIGANSEGVASGRCPVEQQHRPGRLLATAERQLKSLAWSKEDNKRLFKCYIRGETEKRGYRKRLLDLWKTHNTNNELTEVTEHRLADQVRQIKHKTWLETVEQEEITLRVNNKHQSNETMEPNTTDTLHHAAITPDIQEERQSAGSIKIKRYDKRCQQFKQNQLFRTNQKLFYETVDGKERGETELPEPTEATTF